MEHCKLCLQTDFSSRNEYESGMLAVELLFCNISVDSLKHVREVVRDFSELFGIRNCSESCINVEDLNGI